MDAANLDDRLKRIEERLEAKLEAHTGEAPAPARPLLTQGFTLALPIVLTVGLGFVATYYQSRNQHIEQLALLARQGVLEREKQDMLAGQAERARRDEAARTFTLQERDAKAQVTRQERQFAANSAAAQSQFAQTQLTQRMQAAAQQAQQAREFERSLERLRRESEIEIILKASEVPTSLSAEQQDVQRARNLLWFADAGYIRLADETQANLRKVGKIKAGESVSLPVTQSDGGTAVIRSFQSKVSLPADGILGPVTCSRVFNAEKEEAGSTDPAILAKCNERFRKD